MSYVIIETRVRIIRGNNHKLGYCSNPEERKRERKREGDVTEGKTENKMPSLIAVNKTRDRTDRYYILRTVHFRSHCVLMLLWTDNLC